MFAETMQRSPNPSTQQDAPASDEALVSRVLAGEGQAFDQLMQRYQQQFMRVAWGMVKNESEAQDIVQTAFLNIFRKLDTFQQDSSFKSWAYRVVINTGLMRLRKKRSSQEVDFERVSALNLSDEDDMGTMPGLSSWRERADEVIDRRELFQKIHQAVEELPPKYQSVFMMSEYEGLSLKDIGAKLDLSIPAVKSRLHRARLFLRASLEPYVAPAPRPPAKTWTSRAMSPG
jgi:RNA polymerase sigma-70 factor (ECF subfamily)